jgi:hypothetical protein
VNEPKPITHDMILAAANADIRTIAKRNGVSYGRLRRAMVKAGVAPATKAHFERRSRVSSETNPAPESAAASAASAQQRRVRAARWVVMKDGKVVSHGNYVVKCQIRADIIGDCAVVLNNPRTREWVADE